MQRFIVISLFSLALLTQAQTLKPDEHGVIYSNPSNPHLTKTQSEVQTQSESQSPTQAQAPEQTQRWRRWGITPYLGVAYIFTKVSGFDMNAAASVGVRASFDISRHFAVGISHTADFIHFSRHEGEFQGTVDLSSLTHALDLEVRPGAGIYFGPLVGWSQKTFNYRSQGGLSHRDEKGADDLLVYGGFVGWNFKPGKRIHMGPRVNFFHYSATHTDYVSSHSAFNTYFTTKFLF